MRSLYLCYLPLSEPLVETQVLAYLRGLASSGHEIHLATFENERQDRARRRVLRQELAAQGIRWHRFRYHKRLSLLATAWDTLTGMVAGTWLVRRHRIHVVHARNHVPGAMALGIRRLTSAGMLFDVRGLMAEEYADGGLWRTGSLPWRITKAVERACLRRADGVVVLTEGARRVLFDGAPTTPSGAPVVTIPTSADITGIAAGAGRRDEIRASLGLADHRVLAYVGKFSTWYLAEEMAQFFAAAHDHDPSWRLLVLTQSPSEPLTDELRRLGLGPDTSRVLRVEPREVGAHLAAADAAMSFIAAAPSKIASSPTKIGEYLAAGLPIVVSPGVGDTDDLVRRRRVGVVVAGHDRAHHDAAVQELERLLADPTAQARSRAAAEELSLEGVGVPRYVALYDDLARRLAASRRIGSVAS